MNRGGQSIYDLSNDDDSLVSMRPVANHGEASSASLTDWNGYQDNPPHQGASSCTIPKRGRPSSDVSDPNNNEYFGVKRTRLDAAEACQTFASGSNDVQNWQDWDEAPQMFQKAHAFTIQGDSTFNDFQTHVDAPTSASLSRTTAESQYQQNYVPPHSLGYPISGKSYNPPHALIAMENWQTGPLYSSQAGAGGYAQYHHSSIPAESHHSRRPVNEPVTASSVYRPGSSSNSGGRVPEAVNPVSGPSTHSFQGASNLDFSGTTTFINAHTVVVPNLSTRDIAVVAEALSSINFRNFLADHLRKRVGKTGRWVLSEPKFCKWRKGPRGILWGTGMPGAGKTILASIIVEYLMELAKSNKRICVAFAFSRYTDALAVEEILAGLLRQILEDHPQTIVYIQRMHDHHLLRKTRPSKQELIVVLEAIFTSNLFDERFCSLDGLDEAKSTTQFELLDSLSQLPINLLITSRPLHLLEDNVPTADHFSIILQDADIERLIEEKVRQIPTLKGLLAKDEFKQWVVKTIIEKSSGMFLVASLQLDTLVDCVDIQELRQAVKTLPIGVEAMYQATMLRVKAHKQAAKAKRALTWLVHALDSLEMDDLRYAIAVDPKTFQFDSELLIDGPTLLSLCCGLVTFESESGLVRLVHYTAKDYLEPYLKREDPDPHAMLASTCVARLVQFNLNNLPVDTQANYSQRRQYLDDIFEKNPFFLRYSVRRWAGHSHLSDALPASTREFILHGSVFPICLNNSEYLAYTGSSIHVAAAYNFHELLEEWFHPSCHPADGSQSQFPPPSPPDLDINARASEESTALVLATYFSHAETIRVLLNVEGIDVALGDCNGDTALMLAANSGSLEIVEMLLAVVGTNHASSRNEGGETALTLASYEGHVEVVRALVRFQSTNIKNLSEGDSSEEASFVSECGEALVEAALRGHQDIVETLLGVKGINVNYLPKDGRTALMCASEGGHKSTVEMLLQHEDIFIDYAPPNGRTALARALKEAEHDTAELLRSHGAEEPSAGIYNNYIHNHSIRRWE